MTSFGFLSSALTQCFWIFKFSHICFLELHFSSSLIDDLNPTSFSRHFEGTSESPNLCLYVAFENKLSTFIVDSSINGQHREGVS